MAASQRPGVTGRSQTPPAQKPLVRKFSLEASILLDIFALIMLLLMYISLFPFVLNQFEKF